MPFISTHLRARESENDWYSFAISFSEKEPWTDAIEVSDEIFRWLKKAVIWEVRIILKHDMTDVLEVSNFNPFWWHKCWYFNQYRDYKERTGKGMDIPMRVELAIMKILADCYPAGSLHIYPFWMFSMWRQVMYTRYWYSDSWHQVSLVEHIQRIEEAIKKACSDTQNTLQSSDASQQEG